MVESADARQRDDLAQLRPFGRTPGRSITVERHVGPVVVVEADIVANEPLQVALAEDDDVIEQVASDRPDEPLGEAVLPGRSGRARKKR